MLRILDLVLRAMSYRGAQKKGVEGPALTLFAREGGTEFQRGHVAWPGCYWGRWVGECVLRLRAPAWWVWGPECAPCLLPVQQHDDLGAAFRTWMGTSGALRAEVRPGARPLGSFPGSRNGGPLWPVPPPTHLQRAFHGPDGISQPPVGKVVAEAPSGGGHIQGHTASPWALPLSSRASQAVRALAGLSQEEVSPSPAPTAASHGSVPVCPEQEARGLC